MLLSWLRCALRGRVSKDAAWDRLSFFEQLHQNLGAIAGRRRMEEGHDWPEVRVRATLAADARLRAFAKEKEARMAAYECGAASESYRRWRARGRVVDIDFLVASGRRG